MNISKVGKDFVLSGDALSGYEGLLTKKGALSAIRGGTPGIALTQKERKQAVVSLFKQPTTLAAFLGSGAWNLNTKPKMGCDPEIFLRTADAVLPAWEVLESKHKNKAFFWDGVQAEFVTPAQECLQILAMVIQVGLYNVLTAARKATKAELLLSDVVEIPEKQMAGFSDEHVALGCDPSVNVYGMGGAMPADPRALLLRFAGGHIHFGHAAINDKVAPAVREAIAARCAVDLDRVLGVWSVGAAQVVEKTRLRRRFYGLAGEHRLPPHGLEYRTLSNFWLCHPAIFYATFELARAVFQASRFGLLDFWLCAPEVAADVINNYDVGMAAKILKKNEKLFLKLFAGANKVFSAESSNPAVYGAPKVPAEKFAKAAFRVGLEGVECVVEKPLAVEENWVLSEVPAWKAKGYHSVQGGFPCTPYATSLWTKHIMSLK